MKIFVTGGAGFIGSALARLAVAEGHEVLAYDKLTYAGVRESLDPVAGSDRFRLVEGDICDGGTVSALLADFRPDVVAHLAAESHVDRSLDGPAPFIQTNLVGTFVLLQAALDHWKSLGDPERQHFRFHHVSTDEVFGSLSEDGLFSEDSSYDPRSPYSASKAGSDHLVRAWGHSYGLPVLVSNCSNNYGPCQFPEKLIPLTIIRAISDDTLPVYGDGQNVRDWLHVEDHAHALLALFERGQPGETYNVGANAERTNLDVVHAICAALDRLQPRPDGKSYAGQVRFVEDRPGHDRRYAIDATKIREQIGWRPQVEFDEGIERTVRWYLDRRDWWEPILARRYDTNRLGLGS